MNNDPNEQSDREFWRGLRTGAVLAVIVIGGVFLIWASVAGTIR